MVKKVEDLNSMLNALGKSKELAVEEIKQHMAKKEQAEKALAEIKEELRRCEIQKGDLQQCLSALGAKHENLERKHAQLAKEKETLSLHYEAEVEKGKVQLAAAESKLELAQEQWKFEESRSALLMARIRELEAKSEQQQQQQSRPGFARRASKTGDGEEAESQSQFSLRSDASSMTDYESLYLDGQNRITKLEDTVKQLQLGLATAQSAHDLQAAKFKHELDEIRLNRSMSSSYAPSESSSARNLDSAVIHEALNKCMGAQIENFENASSEMENKEGNNGTDNSALSHPVVNQPLFTGTKPKSYRPSSPPTPQIPCSPPTHARFPPVRCVGEAS